MNPKQVHTINSLLSLFLILLAFFAAAPVTAQDAVTVGTVNASGNTVDVPVYIRDVSSTPLGRDQPADSKIQSFTITVNYAPAASVQSVAFARAGITAGLTPAFELSPASAGSISLVEQFSESSNLIPLTLNAPHPGDQVAHLVFTLSSSAAPGSSITLALDSGTVLSNQGGTVSETPPGSLALFNGAINIPQLSLNILPGSSTVTIGDTTTFTAQTDRNVIANTTVTLSLSNPSIATVAPSVVIPAGSAAANFTVTGVAAGSTNINGSLPLSNGGASASAFVTVTEPPPQCATPNAPVVSGPATAEVGKAYAITWAVVSDSTDYVIEESTDANFATVVPSIVTTNSASFTHAAANRYYYRVRARNFSTGCATSSALSNAISVLVSVIPVAQTRILPVVGSTPGSLGSFFKTSVQLYNAKSSAISGKFVFHTQNVSGSSTDPSLAFSIQPGKSLSYPDLLPAMGIASGLGSADLIADAGSAFPISLVRVFNDAGTAGTTGLAEEPMAAGDALQSGETGALIAPADQKFRLNIGVRTLEQGASTTLTVRDKDGTVVKTTATKSFGPNFFIQIGSAVMLDGYVLTGGETITIQMTAGSAFVYGSTTDNTTQDPSVQFARRIE
jgi:Bacterial Ig-like domain (group 2).